MIAFLHSLHDLPSWAKVCLMTSLVVLLVAAYTHFYLGVSHAQSEYHGDDSDGGGF